MLSEPTRVQPLVIRARGITRNAKTARTTPTIVNTIPSKLEGGLRFLRTTDVGRRTGPKNEEAEEVREMGLPAGSDRKGRGSSGESRVRGISFFRFFPWAGGVAAYRLRSARDRAGRRTGSDCTSSRHA